MTERELLEDLFGKADQLAGSINLVKAAMGEQRVSLNFLVRTTEPTYRCVLWEGHSVGWIIRDVKEQKCSLLPPPDNAAARDPERVKLFVLAVGSLLEEHTRRLMKRRGSEVLMPQDFLRDRHDKPLWYVLKLKADTAEGFEKALRARMGLGGAP